MPPLAFLAPGNLKAATGGYVYDRKMLENLRWRGWSVTVHELDGSFPHPTAEALRDTARILAAIPTGTHVVVDGLAFGAMPDQASREAARLRLVALVHLPLAKEIGLGERAARELEMRERRALGFAWLVIVTGRSGYEQLAPYHVNPARVRIIEPGTTRAPLARGGGGSPLRLISVGTINPGKGYDILIRALARLPSRDWRLTCVGSLERHPQLVARLRGLIHREGLVDHVLLANELDEKALGRAYHTSDLFVLATWRETYGMAVAEALMRGLPVVSTTTGALPEIVGDEAGILVPPGDLDGLAAALARVVGDSELRSRLAGGARRARRRLPTWHRASGKMAAALNAL